MSELKFLCESRYRSGKSFIIPFTTELDSKLTGIALCAELRKKYPDSEFWLDDYLHINFNLINENQSTNPCFGYDGCYDSLIIVDNYIVNHIPQVNITKESGVNINTCNINGKFYIDCHFTKDLKTFINDRLYYFVSDKLLKLDEDFEKFIKDSKILQNDIKSYLNKLFETDLNRSIDNLTYSFRGIAVDFNCKVLKTIEDLIPHLKKE